MIEYIAEQIYHIYIIYNYYIYIIYNSRAASGHRVPGTHNVGLDINSGKVQSNHLEP